MLSLSGCGGFNFSLGSTCHNAGLACAACNNINDDDNSAYNHYVVLSNVCDQNSTDFFGTTVELSCDESTKLDYDNIVMNECEEISLTDIHGNTLTGLYLTHVNNLIKCG